MGWITAIVQILKLFGKVLDLFMERDAKKAEVKKVALDKLTDAAKETDTTKRASKLNRVLDDVRGV